MLEFNKKGVQEMRQRRSFLGAVARHGCFPNSVGGVTTTMSDLHHPPAITFNIFVDGTVCLPCPSHGW